jgi:ABC-type dipeptide/oligopeptide/nickel transport system permease component
MKVAFYVARRLGLLIPVLLGVTFITFALTRIIPGDPIEKLAGPYVSAERKAELRRQYALDEPFYVQYVDYVEQLFRGDLGRSLGSGLPVASDLSNRFAATFELTTTALLIALGLGIPLGVAAALWKDTWIDGLARVIAIAGVSIPIFWSGIMLSYFLFYRWGIAPPPYGRIDPSIGAPPSVTGLYTIDSVLALDGPALVAALKALWLPATVMGFAVIAPITRLVRQGMIEALESPSATALRALGAKPSSIVFRHALKNALLPVTTMVAIVYGYLLGGSVLIETIFAWPGMGLYVYNAVGSSDFPAVQGFILYATTMYILVFLVLDLLYLVLDPRVKY